MVSVQKDKELGVCSFNNRPLPVTDNECNQGIDSSVFRLITLAFPHYRQKYLLPRTWELNAMLCATKLDTQEKPNKCS